MKSSWKKLREFAQPRSKNKIPPSYAESTQDLEDIAKRMQKVQEMRKFYEGFHKVSSHVVGRAHGFSEAIQDMGKYLMSNFGPVDDGNVGNILRIVGKVQLEVARVLDLYAVHVSNILTIPTENMLHDVQVVETKLKFDEKRALYEHLRLRLTKGRPKNRKSEIHADHQIQTAKQQFDELALSVGCRVLSLEQGRFHSITTKMSRHHTAQMHLFRRAFASLNKIEPYIDLVAQQGKIDRQVYIEDHLNDSDDESDNVAAAPNEHNDSTSLSSLEQIPVQEKIIDDESFSAWSTYAGSKSVPISPVRLPQDGAVETFQTLLIEKSLKNVKASHPRTSASFEGDQEFLHSVSNVGTFASPSTVKSTRRLSGELQISYVEHPQDQNKQGACSTEMPTNAQAGNSSALKKSHPTFPDRNLQSFSPQPSANVSVPLPPLLASASFKLDGPNSSQVFYRPSSGSAPISSKRYSQSGPLTPMVNSLSGKASIPSSGVLPPLSNAHLDYYFKSGPLDWSAGFRPSILPRTSPAVSPPHISELHELPPPPHSNTPKFNKQSLSSHADVRYKSVKGPDGSSSSNAAPLPLPPPNSDSKTSFLSSLPQRGWKNTAD
ncbi:hypothetical protein O6H91_02G101600 [Diphasiastrum complanatum]|uniref:Uncharacterized protein n=1 Tax=Diphasiastrum complanatum TaxID=34168 RepID=A0ACC2EIT5_DIPCM|nr:hypothetical protein O6H91_02G101600 [Diphasiastrum complanatum]